jgi:hypothetical protein
LKHKEQGSRPLWRGDEAYYECYPDDAPLPGLWSLCDNEWCRNPDHWDKQCDNPRKASLGRQVVNCIPLLDIGLRIRILRDWLLSKENDCD